VLKLKYSIPIIIYLFSCAFFSFSQQAGLLKGTVVDEAGQPLAGAAVKDLTSEKGTITDQDGHFQLDISTGKDVAIEISFLGYGKDTFQVRIQPGEAKEVRCQLKPVPQQISEVVVESWINRAVSLQRLDLKSIEYIPLPSGNIETLLTTMGASSRNEMSSQYSVRGGNFDENLIVVNDIEIYRPLAIKSGQQEGLSFVNSDLVSSLQFSAGGFDVRYGDKMSSVLDIKYKRPVTYGGSAMASLLGASAYFEGCTANKKFTHITGIRYKANQYLLNTLQTEGDYKPRFFDAQTYLTYDLTNNLEISFLGNISTNHYQVIPRSRQTSFGTYQQTLNFTVYYEGQEVDRFSTLMGALTLAYNPSGKINLKLIASSYHSSEAITYDILGQYRIDLLDNTAGSETANDSILNLGYGGSLVHARNYLDAYVNNISHRGSSTWNNNRLSWGFAIQAERIRDKLREWEMIDSAGYSVPFSDTKILPYKLSAASNKLASLRLSGYIHDVISFSLGGSATAYVNGGVRFSYWDLNRQMFTSPRAGITIDPAWPLRITFHGAAGWYFQPPFYKELRDPEGRLYTSIKAQKSIHFLVGATYEFTMWNRPFRLSSELYVKLLDNLIPYVIDDVDIQYLPQYRANGYATGIEFKMNGQFVKDAESWASLSFMQTREDRYGDSYGSYPRPTDQLVNFGLYFQDYFPTNPSYRVHTSIYFGSRLPYHSPDYDRPDEIYHLKAYKRIDLGLSKSLITDKNGNRRIKSSILKDLWFSLEVLNIFGFDNQASYQWIRTVSNQEGLPNMFAVPNYLSGRLFNLRAAMKF
jgi:hypothetical protein